MAEPARARGTTSTPSRSSRSVPTAVRLDLPDLSLTLATDRGVFSPDRVDTGTKHLLLEGPAPPPDRHLRRPRLRLRRRSPARSPPRAPAATVWAVDVNERALDLCRGQRRRGSGSRTSRAVAPDDGARRPRGRRALVEPADPHRQGRRCTTLLGDLARPARDPTGRAVLVVQKHLGADSLQRWLERGGLGASTRLGSRAGYRLLAGAPGVKQLDGTGMKRLHREWRRRTEGRLALVLDDVQGPFNVGAIIRTAAALRVDDVWLAGPHARARRRQGRQDRARHPALPHLPPRRRRPSTAIDAARAAGYRVVGLELADGAAPLHELDLGRRDVPRRRPRGPRAAAPPRSPPATRSPSSRCSAGSDRSTSPPPPSIACYELRRQRVDARPTPADNSRRLRDATPRT